MSDVSETVVQDPVVVEPTEEKPVETAETDNDVIVVEEKTEEQ